MVRLIPPCQDLASFSRLSAPSQVIEAAPARPDENIPIPSANILLLGDVGVGKTSIAKVTENENE